MKLFKIILISSTLLCFTFPKCYGNRIVIPDDEDISEGSGFRDLEKNHTFPWEEITTTATTIKTTEESNITSTSLPSYLGEIYEDSIETSSIKNNDRELYDLDDFEFLENFFENITTENTDGNEQNEYKNNDLNVSKCSSIEENSKKNIGCSNATTVTTTSTTTEGSIITNTLPSNLNANYEDSISIETSSINNNDDELDYDDYKSFENITTENTNETLKTEIEDYVYSSTTKINLELTIFAFVFLIRVIYMKFCCF